jgi:hypothetical protein
MHLLTYVRLVAGYRDDALRRVSLGPGALPALLSSSSTASSPLLALLWRDAAAEREYGRHTRRGAPGEAQFWTAYLSVIIIIIITESVDEKQPCSSCQTSPPILSSDLRDLMVPSSSSLSLVRMHSPHQTRHSNDKFGYNRKAYRAPRVRQVSRYVKLATRDWSAVSRPAQRRDWSRVI